MVAIVSGNRLGLELGSLYTLGAQGAIGNPAEGRNGQGVFVNVATGNLVVQNRDELLMGAGKDAASLRTYNSRGGFDLDNGDNWTNGVERLTLSGVANVAGSTISLLGADGSTALYTFNASSNEYSTTEGAGAYDKIKFVAADNQFQWCDGDTGALKRFSATGVLLSSKEANGYGLTYGYTPSGLLASLTTTSGESTIYDYAPNTSNLTQIRTTAGGITTSRVRYQYDTWNRLANVTVDLSPDDASVADGNSYQTSYLYDGNSTRISRITQPGGTSLAITYVLDPAGSGAYFVSTVSDGLNQVTRYTFDLAGRTAAVLDAQGQSTRYDLDANGQILRIFGPTVNGQSAVRQFSYSITGDIASWTDGESRTAVFEYVNGNQTLQRDALGNTISRTFNAQNQLLTETVFATPDPDGSGVAQPGTPATTRYVYEDSTRNLLRFVLSPEGRVTEHRYNGFGQRIATIGYVGMTYLAAAPGSVTVPPVSQLESWSGAQSAFGNQLREMQYDARGQLVLCTSFARTGSTGAGLSDGTQVMERFVYDRAGLLLQTVSTANGTSNFTYDGLGRLLVATDALGQATVTRYTDATGKTTITAANGLVTTSSYDAAGRPVSVLKTGAGGAGLGETRYFYDTMNRLRMTQDPAGVRNWILYDSAGRKTADIDGNGTVTGYSYDRSDRVVGTVTYVSAAVTGGLVDSWGNPVMMATLASVGVFESSSDARSWRVYDTAGRLVRTAQMSGTGSLAAVTEMKYDGASRLLQTLEYATLAWGGSSSTVPSLPGSSPQDRLTRNFYGDDGELLGSMDAEGYLTAFSYDAAGRLVQRLAYANATSSFMRASGTLAQLQPMSAVTDQRTTLFYDGRGQLAGEVDAEGYFTEYVYDGGGRLVRTLRYANRTSASVWPNSIFASLRPAANANDRVTTRQYDAVGRLREETSPEGVVTQYVYDSVGNLTSTLRAVGSAEVRSLMARFDLLGRVTGELSAEGAALLVGGQTQAQVDAIWSLYATTTTYDAGGRKTSSRDPLGNTTWFYYARDGALAYTINPVGEVTENRYDAMNRVVQQVVYDTRTPMAGPGGVLVVGQVIAPSSAKDSITTFTYTRDGKVASVADAEGNLTTRTYDAFGDEINSTRALSAGVSLTQVHQVDGRGFRTATQSDAAGVNATATTTYDAFGRVVRAVDSNGNVRQQDFDRLGRQVSARDPLGGLRSTSYDAFARQLTQTDALGNVTTFSYDAVTRSMTLVSPEGFTTKTAFTRHGQVLSVTDARQQTTSYAYDRNGQLVGTTTALSAESRSFDRAGRMDGTIDANGNKVAYAYDAANRVLSRTVDPLGLNLRTSYEYDAKGQRVTVVDPNQVRTTFQYDRNGRVLRQTIDPAGLNRQTVYSYDAEGRVLTVTEPAGTLTQYSYDALGRRKSERVDPNGLNLQRFWSYDKNGNVTSSTDGRGSITRYAYDAADRLVFTLDALANLKQTGYDAEGRVVKVLGYATPIATAGLSAVPTVAELQQRVVAQPAQDVVEHRVYDRDGRLAATVDGRGGVVRYTYDNNGNMTVRVAYAKAITLATWAAGTLPTPTADAAQDEKIATVYDALNRAIFTLDGAGAVVAQRYDGKGNLLERLAYATPIPTNTAVTATALAAAAALKADASRDALVRYTYDAADRVVWTLQGTGAVSRRSYDANGNVVQETAFAKALTAGAPVASVPGSADDRVTSRAYDAANRLVFTVDALNAVTEQVFDGNGQVVRRLAYELSLTSLPVLGVATSLRDIRTALRPSAGDRVARLAYDAAGRQALAIDAEGAATEWRYDGAGNVLATTRYARKLDLAAIPAGATLVLLKAMLPVPGEKDRTTRHVYDAAGRERYVIDGLYQVQEKQYDGIGRVLQTFKHLATINAGTLLTPEAVAAALGADPLARNESYEYDSAGNRTKVIDAYGNADVYTFDALGRPLSFRNRNGKVWTYAYDAAGQRVSETSPEVALSKSIFNGAVVTEISLGSAAVVTRMAYDALGRLTARTEAAGRDEQRITSYEYDAAGRQVRVVYPTLMVYDEFSDNVTTNGATGIAERREKTQALDTRTYYDALGNALAGRDVGDALSQKVYDRNGRVLYEVDALGFVTSYSYNAFGQVTALTRNSVETSLAKRTVGAASQAATRSEVEAALATMSHANDRTTWTVYDHLGQAVDSVASPGLVYDASLPASGVVKPEITDYKFNAFGEVVAVGKSRNIAATEWITTTHYFDQAGQETAMVDALGYVTRYQYNARGDLDRKTEYATALAAGSWNSDGYDAPRANAALDHDVAYASDALGRRFVETRVAVESSLAPDGTSAFGNLSTVYGFDAVGNQVSVTDALDNVTVTTYDALGRVTAIEGPPGASGARSRTEYRLDALGNVVAKVERATGTAVDDAGDRRTTTHFDGLGHALEVTDASDKTTYSSFDAYGHVAKTWRGVTDVAGNVRTRFEVNVYDAVGQLVETRTPASNTVLRGGVNASLVPATLAPDNSVATPNKISLTWSQLVDPAESSVRLEVDYISTSTLVRDEYGSPISGEPSRQLSVSSDLSPAQALGGGEITWGTRTAAVTWIRVLQFAGGQWLTKWEGSLANAGGAGMETVSQAQAGVVVTRQKYNGFGEVILKGVNGGEQEYFDYDTAGHVWRTNSGDGVDRIQLYDLQGNVTAEIRSAGQGGDNGSIRGFSDPSVAAAASGTRRVDMMYDALGHLTRRTEAARQESQGGVSVLSQMITASVQTAQPVGDNENASAWVGVNEIRLGWNSMAALGDGELRVSLLYTTPIRIYGGDFYDSTTQPTWTVGGEVKYRQTGQLYDFYNASGAVLTAGATGAVLTWAETSPTPAAGGVGNVTWVRVQKRDVNGNWQTIIEQAPGAAGNEIRFAAPADPRDSVVLEVRPPGSGSWVKAPGAEPVNFGEMYRYDAAPLSIGSFEYHVVTTPQGQSQGTEVATGSITLTAAPLQSIAVPISYGQAGPGVLSWQHQAAPIQQVLNYRPAGSAGGWSALAVTVIAGGALDSVSTAGLGSGSYEFELLWSTGAPTSHATGTFTVTAPTAGYDIAESGTRNVTGVQLGTMQLEDTYVYYSESNYTLVPGAWVPSLSWNACRAAAIYRPVGGAWSNFVVDDRGQTLDSYTGMAYGQQRVSLEGLAPGAYEIEIRTVSGVNYVATATLTIGSQGPSLVVTTAPWTSAQHFDGIPTQYSVSVTTAPGSLAISTAGGVQLAQSARVNGLTQTQRPTVDLVNDRWGNVLSRTDPRAVGWVSTYRYNASNQMIQQALPGVSGIGAAVTSVYYDALGRQVAVKDARGYVNGRKFDGAGDLVQDTHADGGVVRHAYDAFGQKVQTTDAEGHGVGFKYDKLGHVLAVEKGLERVYEYRGDSWVAPVDGGQLHMLTDSWTYDELGQRLKARNGNGEETRYSYDLRGNVVATELPMHQVTRAAFDAQGHKLAEVDAGGIAATWTYDYFGQLTGHQDLGGHVFAYTYDNARQLIRQVQKGGGQNRTYYYDAAGQMIVSADHTVGTVTYNSYDAAGRHIREKVVQSGVIYQDNHLGYDAVGNLRDVADGRVHISMDYDLAGNRTRIGTSVDYDALGGETASTQQRFFVYDEMNRQKVVDALDAAGNISDQQGHKLTYDLNGNRTSDLTYRVRIHQTTDTPVIDGYDGDWQAQYNAAAANFSKAGMPVLSIERYKYDSLNRLKSVERDGVQVDLRLYDGADREIFSGAVNLPPAYRARLAEGLSPGESDGHDTRMNRYDANGRLLHQQVLRSSGAHQTDISWDPNETMLAYGEYRAGGYDPVGNVSSYTVWNRQTDQLIRYQNDNNARFDRYQTQGTTVTSPGRSTASTTQRFDVNGYLVGVTDSAQWGNNRSFVNDATGKALLVNQSGRLQRQVIAKGEVLGLYGVGVNEKKPLVNGNPNFADIVDFDFGYSPIKNGYPSPAPGVYVIRTGDTLQSIAQSAYGDSALWYRIAEANGLASSSDLKVGQSVNIPNRVSTINNNNGTFKPYDPSRITGDLTPALPMPAQDGGCGGIGKVLMVIVAIVVTVYTLGTMTAETLAAETALAGGVEMLEMTLPNVMQLGAQTLAAGSASLPAAMASAATGSVASQGVGLATGAIDKFSWKQVGLAALSAGVTNAIGGEVFGRGMPAAVARSMLSSTVTQGIAVGVGLQQRFNWRDVAAAGVGSAVGAEMGEGLKNVTLGASTFSDAYTRATIVGMGAGLATAVARGGRVNVVQVATDAFGNALGESLASAPPAQDVVNGMDLQSDPPYEARRAQESIAQSDTIQNRKLHESTAADSQDNFRATERAYRQELEAERQVNGLDLPADYSFPQARIRVAEIAGGDPTRRAMSAEVIAGVGPRARSAAQLAREESSELTREMVRAAEVAEANGVPRPPSMRELGLRDNERRAAELRAYWDDRLVTGSGLSVWEPAPSRAKAARDAALLNFLGGQNQMALGGVASAGVMIGTGDIVAASEATDSLATFDSVIAPTGWSAAARLGRVRGTRPIDYAKAYEADVRSLYGDVPFAERTYTALVNGLRVRGVADNVAVIGGRTSAIEAKFVDDWATSLRNPASPEGNRPWAAAEQQNMIDQAVKYSRAFEQTVYHTNSVDLANYYTPLFERAGATNFKFVITQPKQRRP